MVRGMSRVFSLSMRLGKYMSIQLTSHKRASCFKSALSYLFGTTPRKLFSLLVYCIKKFLLGYFNPFGEECLEKSICTYLYTLRKSGHTCSNSNFMYIFDFVYGLSIIGIIIHFYYFSKEKI
jgi:hypothetical protein